MVFLIEEYNMKIANVEVTDLQNLTRIFIQGELIHLEDRVLDTLTGGLDLRSKTAQYILKENNGLVCSELEFEMFMKTLKFEVAKIIGKLENQTGVVTGIVKRNTAGNVDKQSYNV